MVFFNHATRQMTAKIVYYGPGLCGKTTNLNTIYAKTSQKARGEMVSLNTETDRTLFFDLLPLDVGMVGGFKTKLQLYTVPGQVFYNSTRKLVLKGVDGIVFVVDSQAPMLDACRESYQNLEENLHELGLVLADIPVVYQWNKRDLRNVLSVEELEATFNPKGTPSFQSVASDGTGVFETLRGVTKLALSHIKTHVLGEPAPARSVPVRSAQAVPAVPVVPAQVHPRSAGEALTMSDLPSVSDLLEMEGSSAAAQPGASAPLPDEDDEAGFFIEAPNLPEPPAAMDDGLAFLTEELPPLPPLPIRPEPREEDALPLRVEAEPPPRVEAHGSRPAGAEPELPATPEPPATPGPPAAVPARAPLPKPAPRVDPMAALASLKLEARRPVAKPKAVDPKDAINSLMGELTQAGRSGAPSVLRLEVPSEVDGQEIEVFVQVRRQGQVLVEGQVLRSAPAKGSTVKLSVELKRA